MQRCLCEKYLRGSGPVIIFDLSSCSKIAMSSHNLECKHLQDIEIKLIGTHEVTQMLPNTHHQSSYHNKSKDWALVQTAALPHVEVKLQL